MQHLGQTRSAHRRDHLLQTPDTFVRAPLPGMHNATAIVHVAPAAGAQFTQYTAEFEAGGSLAPAAVQRFVYVLEGELEIEGRHSAARGDYATSRRARTRRLSARKRGARRRDRKALSAVART